jgi:hypothetical protein
MFVFTTTSFSQITVHIWYTLRFTVQEYPRWQHVFHYEQHTLI